MKRVWGWVALVLALGLLAGCSTVNDQGAATRLGLAALNTDPGYMGNPVGTVDSVTPSTNQINYDTGYAYVQLVAASLGQVELKFVTPNNWYSCFEYRSDDEAPTSSENGGNNYNTDVTDGLWNYTCVHGGTSATPAVATETISASDHVDVRMVFGAETDERFDWTRFYPLTLSSMDQCKDGAWEGFGFKNQGQCIASVVANDNSVH